MEKIELTLDTLVDLIKAAKNDNIWDFIKGIIEKYTENEIKNTKDKLLERLFLELKFKYVMCPEGELIEDVEKRKLKGEGFRAAIEIVSENPISVVVDFK